VHRNDASKFQSRYGRKNELEADLWGLRLLNESHYNSSAMIKVMEVLKAESKNRGGPDIFQTHPNPDLRIKQIKEHLEKIQETSENVNGYSLQELYRNPSLIGQKHS